MHVMLYVLDALRADHLSCYGYGRYTTPHIDALAREGVLFENCFTASTWTRPVAASLLTGTYPTVHNTQTRRDMFSTPLARLPEILQAVGFRTAAFSTMGNVASEIGFGRGFDTYHDLFRDPDILARRRRLDAAKEGLVHDNSADIALPRAEDINPLLLSWLETQDPADTFSFIWSIETHVPYTPPTAFRRFSTPNPDIPNEGEREDVRSAGPADRERLMALYDDGILYNDYCIGQIVSCLKERGLYDDTLLVIVGDHGDAFYEHGVYTHGHTPYEELIHVPLIFKLPGQQHAGTRVAALAELVDVLPTIAAAVNAPLPAHVQGQNLLPLLEGWQSKPRDYVFSETQSLEIHNTYRSVRNERWKFVQIQRPRRDGRNLTRLIKHVFTQRMLADILRHPAHFVRSYFKRTGDLLFDLDNDPGEQHNVIDAHPDIAARMREALAAWQEQNRLLAAKAGEQSLTFEENAVLTRHLQELGYM